MSDFLILGGGMAGASAGYFLAEHGSVVLLEKEDQPGYHSTGRSAALFTENYGSPTIRALSVGTRPFLEDPPAGFADHPLLGPRGVLMLAPPSHAEIFAEELANGRKTAPELREVSLDEAAALCPVLRPGAFVRAMYEPTAMDMDVHAIHQGFLRGFRARGGRVVTAAEPRSLSRADGVWRAETSAGDFAAPVVVNAGGAWADEIARMAGVRPIGLVPKRRTAFTFDPPAGTDVAHWPLTADLAESFYFKPEAGRVLASPADETPMPPCDVQPDEIDVATAAARIEAATVLEVRRITHKWAGLRSFVADKTPVVGFAPDAPGFFWLAGQGGYGIQTSAAMGRVAAALATSGEVPADLARLGVRKENLAPERLGS
ncbi:MAG TPA: FAD-binding oxidoreductase [Stellaceae bacterium]|nr:FAD-binding oxidoreductase [Stellaceae bacterium]